MTEVNRAHLYDLRTASIDRDFYAIDILVKDVNNILEVGCSTGRICCHIAKAGANITGVERDRVMFEVGVEKCLSLKTCKLIHADFLLYDAEPKYDCILFGFNVFSEFLDRGLRRRALEKAKSLLLPEGTIVLFNDLVCPGRNLPGEAVYRRQLHNEQLGRWDCEIACSRDFVRNVSFCRVSYRDMNDTHREIHDEYACSLLTYEELVAVYREANLEISAEYGTYEMAPYSPDSDFALHVLRAWASEQGCSHLSEATVS